MHKAISTFFENDPSAIGKSFRAERTASMVSLGPKPNSMEANTALPNDGIVHDLKERAYVCSTSHVVNRPWKCATSNETTRPGKGTNACFIPNRKKPFNGHVWL
uniref:Uncharacterized protein n=1 Tax=Panagrellus redivivus TaxID=6233 RepID=A0A7E4V0S2_PANRE